MKKLVNLLLLLVLLTLVGLGCNTPTHIMHIEGKDKIIINQSEQLKVIYQGTELPLENLEWTLSDYEIASIENGVFYAKDHHRHQPSVRQQCRSAVWLHRRFQTIPRNISHFL